MCMNWFWQEYLRGIGVGTQTAEATLFLQFEDDSEMEGALEVKGSCQSLDMFF